MQFTIKEKHVDVKKEVDVLVVGGGPAGIGAAVAAARSGQKVMLLEKRGFLGGNITGCYVETCNHFLHGTSFEAHGIYAEIEEKYKEQYGRSHDIRINSPHRFSSEYLKVFLDEFLLKEGVELSFHSFVNDVIVEENKIQCVIIQSKKGPVAIKAAVVIDASGDGDVAFSAGVPFEQGRDTDGLCQPGTVNFRLAGADVNKLTGEVDQLKVIGKRFNQDYRAGKTGLSCKRQDLPFGRLTPGGQITYVNYPCAYKIDPTDVEGLTRGELECRQYIMEFYEYAKKNFEGFENIELASIAPEIGFRDSRRIKGLYRLTKEDIEAQRVFDDAIALYPRIYDMLAPDAYMDGDGKMEGEGYKGHIYEPITDTRTYTIPYRSLLPVDITNLIVAGRCISADHVAESSIRGISCCMLTGQAAGAAAGLANKSKVAPKDIDVKELQAVLRTQRVVLP
ncbi:FAD-dependent oxidoreductase [Mobilitalea sibirica]|uniref:FAD-dependent oxidoreductase n=1 Tax=Mobilitalea sibirica TaxID=1462919 RepID=A0A8J7H1B8_9FIRM|nr:FAD-dependent oxidoreductase [Mobilitalea sibirica]MBH1940112.1 FAD-dependent oxidoreductase [Mobilitalea sibirica]